KREKHLLFPAANPTHMTAGKHQTKCFVIYDLRYWERNLLRDEIFASSNRAINCAPTKLHSIQ
ncbi:MAG: hypothetical protein NUV63_05420, partial [Gallionella sp.]|nr:hypothetical protein [Gallionella sp.]